MEMWEMENGACREVNVRLCYRVHTYIIALILNDPIALKENKYDINTGSPHQYMLSSSLLLLLLLFLLKEQILI